MKLHCTFSHREFTFQTHSASLTAEEWEQILTLIAFFSGEKESLTLVISSLSAGESDSIRMFGVAEDMVSLIRQFLANRRAMSFRDFDALCSGEEPGDYPSFQLLDA